MRLIVCSRCSVVRAVGERIEDVAGIVLLGSDREARCAIRHGFTYELCGGWFLPLTLGDFLTAGAEPLRDTCDGQAAPSAAVEP